jgi:hypothetical protein
VNKTPKKSQDFEKFMRAMARISGVSRKKLEQMMFIEPNALHVQRSRPARINRGVAAIK